MMGEWIEIRSNEEKRKVKKGTTFRELQQLVAPTSDVVIVNGFPLSEDRQIEEGDYVVWITKGVMPTEEELEALMRARHTPGIHEKLKQSVVAIAGLGGLGSTIAISLARIGVGTLLLLDFDVVEPSNLNRQQYFIEDIGEYKAFALQKQLVRINPFVKVVPMIVKLTQENIHQYFQEAHVVIEAFDQAQNKAMLVNYMIQHRPHQYLIASSGMAGYGESNEILTTKIRKGFYLCGDRVMEAREGRGLMAPRVGICANHMANMAVTLLIEGEGNIDKFEEER